MSVTLSVKMLPAHPEENPWYRHPVYLAGWLLLDDCGAWLHDWEIDRCVPLCDPEAVAAIREAIPAGDYLGEVMFEVRVRRSDERLELHDVEWVTLYEPRANGPSRMTTEIHVRSMPPWYRRREAEHPFG